ncbi:hypothetical protein DPV78_012451 [Talaromyces pinophilus]|nr:hypothetical protein DPV78_012451 [Talaromyces pinophilus]
MAIVRLEKSVADLDVLIPTPTRSIVEGVYTIPIRRTAGHVEILATPLLLQTVVVECVQINRVIRQTVEHVDTL